MLYKKVKCFLKDNFNVDGTGLHCVIKSYKVEELLLIFDLPFSFLGIHMSLENSFLFILVRSQFQEIK